MIIPFLKMTKTFLQENLLDSELVYVHAKSSKLTDLEKFVNEHNIVIINDIGDKGVNEELYASFKIPFYEYQQ